MKTINTIKKGILATVLLFSVTSCTATSTSVGGVNVDTSSMKFSVDSNGTTVERSDKTFSTGETANISFIIKGLKVIGAKIKVNQDFVVKNEGKEILNQQNALGADGATVPVNGVAADYNGNDGTVPSYITIPVKDGMKGNVNVSIVIKDLNAPGSTVNLDTSFTVK